MAVLVEGINTVIGRTTAGGKIRRGWPMYGTDVGVVLLDTTLPRPVGDIGNARTFPFPVAYEVARGVTGHDARGDPTPRVRDGLINAANELVAKGVKGIATSCGLLVVYQDELANGLGVPVATSSLLQVPFVLRLLRDEQKVGVLTISAERLGDRHLSAAGVDGESRERVVVGDMDEAGHFVGAITGSVPELDVEIAEAEVVRAAGKLVENEPSIGALVLECTNMCVYSAAVRKQTGVAVWDAVSLMRWLNASVSSDGWSG